MAEAAWGTFATITGTAAAALTGLLFVAVSIRIGYIAGSPELRDRAAQTLLLFAMVLVVSALIVIPGQTYTTLGGELIGIAVLSAAILRLLDRAARSGGDSEPLARMLDAAAPNGVVALLLLAAGLVLVVGPHWGMYLLVGPMLLALGAGIVTTWLFLTGIEEPATAPGASPEATAARAAARPARGPHPHQARPRGPQPRGPHARGARRRPAPPANTPPPPADTPAGAAEPPEGAGPGESAEPAG
jgi:hypothetical protein